MPVREKFVAGPYTFGRFIKMRLDCLIFSILCLNNAGNNVTVTIQIYSQLTLSVHSGILIRLALTIRRGL